MTRGKKIGILVTLVVFAAFLVLLWFLLQNWLRPAKEVTLTPQIAPTPAGQPAPALTPEAQEARVQSVSVQTLAKTFTERYGSYSTESNFENLRDVLPLMSSAFFARTGAQLAAPPPEGEFYGVTTRVVSITVENMDETQGVAEVTVSTQREEARGTAQNATVKYQDLQLEFVRENAQWKVDSATWL